MAGFSRVELSRAEIAQAFKLRGLQVAGSAIEKIQGHLKYQQKPDAGLLTIIEGVTSLLERSKSKHCSLFSEDVAMRFPNLSWENSIAHTQISA